MAFGVESLWGSTVVGSMPWCWAVRNFIWSGQESAVSTSVESSSTVFRLTFPPLVHLRVGGVICAGRFCNACPWGPSPPPVWRYWRYAIKNLLLLRLISAGAEVPF